MWWARDWLLGLHYLRFYVDDNVDNDADDGMQRGKVAGGHLMTGEALKKLQQQMKVNRDERRLTVSYS